MKKLFYIFFVLVLSFILAIVLHYDSQVVILVSDYEIITNLKIIFLILSGFFIFIQCIFSIFNIITSISKEKVNKKVNREAKKYENYLKNINEAITYRFLNNFKLSYEKVKSADKCLKNDLTDLVKSQILSGEHKYQDSVNIIANIDFKMNKNKKFNRDLLLDNVNLSNAIEIGDDGKIEVFANKILAIQPNNIKCLELLYGVYKKQNRFDLCLKILPKIKKTIEINEYKKELLLVNRNLAEQYFDAEDFKNSLKYSLLVFKSDKNLYNNNKILILSLKSVKSRKIDAFIRKIWKYTPRLWLGDLYLRNVSITKKIKIAKSLYNINRKDINSVVFYCDVLIENNRIELINNDLKNILSKYKYREVFSILLKIEEKNKYNSFLIENYREKMLNSEGMNNE